MAEADMLLEDDIGSGSDICSAWTEGTCPSQCVWCVEARLCAAEMQACAFTASPDGDALSGWLLLVAFAIVIVLVQIASSQHRRSGTAVAGADDGGEYTLGGLVSDAHSEPSSSSAIELESKTLLDTHDERTGRLLNDV
mmetsp:Transcript_18096/g.46273  ORF Transcript_18096/g.46273 Transcript_18096/m.46273 type:complete len:139 (-) Transcript_18096:151-567(-)